MRFAMIPAIVLATSISAWAQTKPAENKNTSSAAPPVAGVSASAGPIDTLSWLVGGVWTADASKLGPGMLRIETRYQWADNNAFLRFNTHFVFDRGAVKTYDGNFFWNPQQKELAVWYMDKDNEITQGPVHVDGDNMSITFRGQDFAGKMADLRVIVMRKNNDDYVWSLNELQSDGAWKELFNLEYRRSAGS